MKKSELKKIIVECIEEMDLDERGPEDLSDEAHGEKLTGLKHAPRLPKSPKRRMYTAPDGRKLSALQMYNYHLKAATAQEKISAGKKKKDPYDR